jgi:thiamine biosynthesis lipoprotein
MAVTSDKLYARMDAVRPDAASGGYYSASFHAMGTACRVIYSANRPAAAEQFRKALLRWLAEFEAQYSRYLEDSLISEINRSAGAGWVDIDEELESMFQLCDWYHWRTDGIFDPSTLPLIKLWDYQAERPVVPDDASIRSAVSLVNWRMVQRERGKVMLPHEGMAIDIGGIGKEYAVDRVMAMAQDRGVRDILIDFGQDLRCYGSPPEGGAWRIGLEHPQDPGKCWTGVSLDDRAVATSGDYHRHFELGGKRYGHILDPRTGYPVNHDGQAVSVIAPTCTEAGILATTAFVLGPFEGLAFLESCHQAEASVWAGKHQTQTGRFSRYVL